ncbi:hypothetical protein IGI04_022027 [Brassica rapa subsp. trilocularis]|uniref:Uncharacterized protein n=1 Tax=Brassica rapa subsp. trilocularis TaxID=1813537 RepID=A0ABQ7LZT6_BRACM|nr:hypothetical protein IGI04_022027 [Brassica rapa subsp. trilocularis]
MMLNPKKDTTFVCSIGETIKIGQKQQKGKLFSVQAAPQLPVEKILPPTLKDDGSLRFPWAVRMNQSSRNFYRAAEPTYQLYDTPQVTIPSKVFNLKPENNEQYIIGQFHSLPHPPIIQEPPTESHDTTPSEVAFAGSLTHSHEEQPIGPYTPLAHNYQQIHTEPELPVSYGKETGYDMVRKTYSYLTREGRSIKPTQNIQDMG